MQKDIIINNNRIGFPNPCFIIAEAGVNHNGNFDLAIKLIDEAFLAGANAIKFQTFQAEKIVSSLAKKAQYQERSTGDVGTQLEMIKKFELSFSEFLALSNYCCEKGIIFLSTPFEEESADFLDSLGMPAFKMASGELTNLPFQAHVARKGKPMIVSTGMSNLDEIALAIKTIQSNGNPPVVLLHCTSNYPTPPEEANLNAMKTIRDRFNLLVGYSDHTEGIEIPIAAVSMGACVIEKHFTLDKKLPGPDHKASLEPTELRQMVTSIRKIEQALGDGVKKPTASEMEVASVARKSLFVKHDLITNHQIQMDDLISLRPGTGISPINIDKVIGRKVNKSLEAGTMLKEEDLD